VTDSDHEKPVVLIVDDPPENIDALRVILEKDYRIQSAPNGAQALQVARANRIDLILLGAHLPDMDGCEVCRRLRGLPERAATPIILVAARAEADEEERGFELGAADYIHKPLIPAVVRMRVRTHLRLQQALKDLEQLAFTDRLTGAWNRRYFEQIVAAEIARSRRYRQPLSLIFIDIDHFKRVNDRHGHQTGDVVLIEVTQLVRESIRHSDILTRWGGEEFIVLVPATRLNEALALAEKLRAKLAAYEFPEVGPVTISLGVAEYLLEEELDGWLRRADQALYAAKGNGRNQVRFDPATACGMPDSPSANLPLVRLIWRDSYQCGHPLMDAQHQALFALANELLAAVIDGRAKEAVRSIIHKLLAHTVQHFADEEALQRESGFPGWESHQRLHGELVQKALALERDFLAGELGVARVFEFLAYELVARHMLVADREFFPYLAGREASVLSPCAG
jgi:diguanylate cyclase (GGDEF)-like protein/hemerythrin-like metal-binding protein